MPEASREEIMRAGPLFKAIVGPKMSTGQINKLLKDHWAYLKGRGIESITPEELEKMRVYISHREGPYFRVRMKNLGYNVQKRVERTYKRSLGALVRKTTGVRGSAKGSFPSLDEVREGEKNVFGARPSNQPRHRRMG